MSAAPPEVIAKPTVYTVSPAAFMFAQIARACVVALSPEYCLLYSPSVMRTAILRSFGWPLSLTSDNSEYGFGWLLDRGAPSAVFYAVVVALALSIFTVLRLPERAVPVSGQPT